MEQFIDKINTSSVLVLVMIALEIVFVPLFLHYYWPGRSYKSLATKTISSFIFIFCGVFAAQLCYALNNSYFHGASFELFKFTGDMLDYPRYIILGLIFGMLGDVILHKLKGTNLSFICGMLLFLAGHIFYIKAFDIAKGSYRWDTAELTGKIIIGVGIAFVAAILIASIVTKKIKGRVPVLGAAAVYGIVLFSMVSKAVGTAMTIAHHYEPTGMESLWGNPYSTSRPDWMITCQKIFGDCEAWQLAVVALIAGSVLFAFSDLLLGFMMAREKGFGKPPKRSLRIINILTYYTAQIILAVSIIVIPLGFEWVGELYGFLGIY